MPFTKTSRKNTNAMPSIKTLRRYYPDCKLSNSELLEIAEWVKNYSGKNFISPDNKILAALIAMEEARKSTLEIQKDVDLMGQIHNTEDMLNKIKLWDADVLRVMLYSIQDRTILRELVEIGEDFYKAREATKPKLTFEDEMALDK